MPKESSGWAYAQTAMGVIFTASYTEIDEKKRISGMVRRIHSYLLLSNTPNPHDEARGRSLLVASHTTSRSRSPSPFQWLTQDSSEDTEPKEHINTKETKYLMFCQNVHDIEAAMAQEFTVIHVHPKCKPLQHQAQRIGHRLRYLEYTGITSALFALFGLRRFTQSRSLWFRQSVWAGVTLGVVVSIYASIVHYQLCKQTRWAKSVDYRYMELPEVEGGLLVRADCLPASATVSFLPARQSWLHVSLYALTVGACSTFVKAVFYRHQK